MILTTVSDYVLTVQLHGITIRNNGEFSFSTHTPPRSTTVVVLFYSTIAAIVMLCVVILLIGVVFTRRFLERRKRRHLMFGLHDALIKDITPTIEDVGLTLSFVVVADAVEVILEEVVWQGMCSHKQFLEP